MNNLTYQTIILLIVSSFFACNNRSSEAKSEKYTTSISDDSLLNLVQYQTFQYFWENAEQNSGMARERTHLDNIYPENDQNVVTSGGSGFGLMAIIVGIERKFITREQGVNHFEKIVNFLEKCDRFHGVYPHWWYGDTGKVKPFSPKDDGGDLVETAFLMQGLLTVRTYLNQNDENEKSLAARIDTLWRQVEWNWHTQGKNILYWHWSPNHGWAMNFGVQGYNECLIMYVLAASSPTYPISSEVYHQGWAMNGKIKNDTTYLGYETVLNHFDMNSDPIGPLFWAHYSYLGLNPKGLKDNYADYWMLNVNHAKINVAYAIQNPKNYKGYGEKCWGLTSSYSINGYAGHQPNEDLGVISPTAALSSFPYTPNESMKMLKYLYFEADDLVGKYGPFDAFSIHYQWILPRYLAIDQGPIPVMIENYRTGLLWSIFMNIPEIQNGLKKLDFTYPSENE